MTSVNSNIDLSSRFAAVPSPSYGALTHKVSTYFTNQNDTATLTIPTVFDAGQNAHVCSRIATSGTAAYTLQDNNSNTIAPSTKMTSMAAGATSVTITAGAADMWVDAYFAM